MDSEKSSEPRWSQTPPAMFDIVTGYFPESKPKGGAAKLRPMCVTKVLRNKNSGQIACEVAYGTTNLKTWAKMFDDIIIQNLVDLNMSGLPTATRFVLEPEQRAILPWTSSYFGCWSEKPSPKIGSLPVEYQKDYAFAMMRWAERNKT